MRGQGVVISHKKETPVLVLHLHKILYSSKIIPQVKFAGRPDSA
jgi:hypothetical protein